MKTETEVCSHRESTTQAFIDDRRKLGLKAETTLFCRIRRVLCAALLLSGLAGQAAPPPTGVAPVTVPAGGFSIKGGLIADGTSGDWLPDSVGKRGVLDSTGAPLNPATTFHFVDPYNSHSDNVFAGGIKWDSDPNTWQWTTSTASAKNDLNNVLLHITTDTNMHTWLIVAADRLSTSGNSYIDFEFLQNTLLRETNGNFISAGPDGGRTDNDLLLSLAFTGGGTVADFFAFRWLPDGNGGFTYVDSTSALPVGRVFVAANTNTVSVPFGAFGQTTYAPNAFAEAAIDLTALMGNFDPCLSIGVKTIMVKTKTSPSDSAPITDFIDPIQFALRLGPGAYAGPDQTQCAQGDSTSFSLQGQVTPGDLPVTATTWSVVSGTATIQSPASLNTTAQISSPSATLRLTVLQANGCSNSSDIVLTVAPVPACSISGPELLLPLATSEFSAPDGMTSYSWSISGNASITGPTNAQVVTVNAGASCGTGFTLVLNVVSNTCSSTCTSDIVVNDTVPPTIVVPPDVVLECPADTSTNNTGSATAQDNSGQVTVTYSDSVAAGCGGTRTVTRVWTATDACGNSADAIQLITVQDSTPPVVIPPADITIACTDLLNPNSNAALGVATATDGCSGASTPTYIDQTIAGNCAGNYIVRRTWISHDSCGNLGTAVQTITVRDTAAPIVTAPADLTVACSDSLDPSANTALGIATVTDGCSTASTPTYSDQIVPGNCSGNYTIRRAWSSQDGCGNVGTALQIITVQDTTPPTITAPANLVLAFTADISTNNTGVATAHDTCSAVTLTYHDTVTIESDGTQVIARNWTASDACGNSASAVQTITLDAPGALVLPAQTNITLTDLSTLTVTNTATNPNVPANPMTYQLVNPPAGASIDANGIITWTPTVNQSPSTNVFTTIVTSTATTSAGTSTISATNGFLVIVSGPYDGINLDDPTQSLADNDGDGLSNLLEYSVGSDPNNSADANTGIIVWITQDSGSHYLAMKFKERINAAALGLQYFPEVSADKLTWAGDSANVLQVSVDPLDSQFNWVTVRDMTPITAPAARFIHLRVVYKSTIETVSPIWIGTDTIIQGNGGSGSKLTMFSQRMVLPIIYAGTVSSLQNTALTDTNATWTTGQFPGAGTPAYAEFNNGWMVDISGSASTTKTLSLAGNLAGVASPGDAYRVRQHFTIASLFGTNNETGLQTGESAAQADTILLQMTQNQSTMTIFYYSNQYYHGWVRGDLSPADDQVVYPEEGVMVVRIAPENRDLFVCGPIKTGVAVAPIEPGYKLLGTLKSLSSVALGALNLYTGDATTGFASGVTAAGSDNLLVVLPNGTTTTYFYYNQPGVFTGWVDGALNPSDNLPIPAGSAFFIKRLNTNGQFNWTIPAE